MTGKYLSRVALALAPVAPIAVLALVNGGYDLPVRQQTWLALWWLLALGLAFSILPRSAPPRSWRLAACAALAFGGIQLVSVAWGPSFDKGIADACRTFGYLATLGLAWAALSPRSWSWTAAGLFTVGAAVTGIALLGRLFPDLMGLESQVETARLAEPLGYWNALSAWAGITLAMGLAWSADARGARTRVLAAAILPVAGTVVYLTYSRGGVLVSALGIALVIGLTLNRRRAAVHALAATAAVAVCVLLVRSQPEIADGTGTEGAILVALGVAATAGGCALVARWTRGLRRVEEASGGPGSRLAFAGVTALAAALLAIALAVGSDGFGRGGDAGTFVDDDPSARLTTTAGNRSAYWSEAVDAFAEHPLRGEGAGAFGYRWAAEGSEPEAVSDAHSLILATASELGLLGLLALAALLAGLVAGAAAGLEAAGRSAPATALAAGFAGFLLSAAIDWTWESTALASLGLACAGTLAMAASKRVGQPGAPRLSGRARWAMVAIAVLLGAIQVPAAVSTDSLRDSERLLAGGEPAAAAASATRSIRAAPWSAAAYAARAEAKLRLDDAPGARADALAAIDREPREAEHWILLARAEAAADDLLAVVEALREAVRLSPHEAQLGSDEVHLLGDRLERNGFTEPEIIGQP